MDCTFGPGASQVVASVAALLSSRRMKAVSSKDSRLRMDDEDPLYRQVQRLLAGRIAAAEWAPGTALPSETQLAKQMNISVSTVRAAVAELVAAQVLIRRQGKGTFISPRDEDSSVYRFFHVFPDAGPRERPVSEIVSLLPDQASIAQAEVLGLGRTADQRRVWRITNVLKMADVPVQAAEIVLSRARFPRLDARALAEAAPTIYGSLQRLFGVTIVRTDDRLKAVRAPPRIARLLRQPSGAPVLRIDRLARAIDGSPIEVRQSWIRADTHHLFLRQGGFD